MKPDIWVFRKAGFAKRQSSRLKDGLSRGSVLVSCHLNSDPKVMQLHQLQDYSLMPIWFEIISQLSVEDESFEIRSDYFQTKIRGILGQNNRFDLQKRLQILVDLDLIEWEVIPQQMVNKSFVEDQQTPNKPLTNNQQTINKGSTNDLLPPLEHPETQSPTDPYKHKHKLRERDKSLSPGGGSKKIFSDDAKILVGELREILKTRGGVFTDDWERGSLASCQSLLDQGVTPENISRGVAWLTTEWAYAKTVTHFKHVIKNWNHFANQQPKPKDGRPIWQRQWEDFEFFVYSLTGQHYQREELVLKPFQNPTIRPNLTVAATGEELDITFLRGVQERQVA